MEIKRVWMKIDPTGTLTVTVIGLNAKGQVVIGHCGGCTSAQVSSAVRKIAAELDRTQSHYAMVAPDLKEASA